MASFFGLLLLWPVLLIVAIMVKIKMPGGPAFFCQKFRTMVVAHNGSSVSVSGDSRITPLGAKLYFDFAQEPECALGLRGLRR